MEKGPCAHWFYEKSVRWSVFQKTEMQAFLKQLWSRLSLARSQRVGPPGTDLPVLGFLSWNVARGGERGSEPGMLTSH